MKNIDSKEVRASVINVDVSLDKVVSLASVLHNMSVEECLRVLSFPKTKTERIILKLLKSCIANAENNMNLNIDKLFISKIYAGRGTIYKRFKACGRGKSAMIRHVMCNIYLHLELK